jgi:hypothetical protein
MKPVEGNDGLLPYSLGLMVEAFRYLTVDGGGHIGGYQIGNGNE